MSLDQILKCDIFVFSSPVCKKLLSLDYLSLYRYMAMLVVTEKEIASGDRYAHIAFWEPPSVGTLSLCVPYNTFFLRQFAIHMSFFD